MGISPEGAVSKKLGPKLRFDRGEKEVPMCRSRANLSNPGLIGARLPNTKPI
jgi:hypothetical protein